LVLGGFFVDKHLASQAAFSGIIENEKGYSIGEIFFAAAVMHGW
jgi:hypothetical protein